MELMGVSREFNFKQSKQDNVKLSLKYFQLATVIVQYSLKYIFLLLIKNPQN